MNKVQFLIGAGASGCGKTTISIGLMRALSKRGLKVQPFKCGPDYIDTKFHFMATGNPSINLDTFLASPAHAEELFVRYSERADASVVEGVMGIFDGYARSEGSSAEIAMLLKLPVIIVMNSRSLSYSVAPQLYGLKHFRPELDIAGVIFNFVSSENHYRMLREAAEDVGVRSLGFLKRERALEIPSRHLGLNSDPEFCFDEFADLTASALEKSVDVDGIVELCSRPLPEISTSKAGAGEDSQLGAEIETGTERGTGTEKVSVDEKSLVLGESVENVEDVKSGKSVKASGAGAGMNSGDRELRISVARDDAFNFYYEENLEALKRFGKVTFFSPLRDSELPPTDFLYLPGGYPELHLEALEKNRTMLASIRSYCLAGGRTLAECGGMLYLCSRVTDMEGRNFGLVGLFPRTASFEQMKLSLGYRRAILPDGSELRGHEFHYSRLNPPNDLSVDIAPSSIRLYNASGEPVTSEILHFMNTTASYIHFYWGDSDHLPFSL